MSNFVSKSQHSTEAELTLREKFILKELDGYVRHNNNLPKISLLKRLSELMLAEVRNIDRNNELKFGNGFKLDEYLEECEKDIIRYALYISGNNQIVASRLLGMKPTTLNMKLKRYRLYESVYDEGPKTVSRKARR
jgi:DNA-binding NtrC family response regulator